MAYVPGCSADVFISYAHDDDQDHSATRLCERIAKALKRCIPEAEVWFDRDIEAGEYPQRKIQERLTNTPVFVAIVSPSFNQSRYCRKLELDFFLKQPGRRPVIQLVKVPLYSPEQDMPLPEAKWVLLYDEEEREWTDERLDEALIKPIIDIRRKLDEIWNEQPKVFLAQIEDSAAPAWNDFKRALREEGFAVLPRDWTSERHLKRIEKDIEQAAISIHLLSARDDWFASRQLEIAKRIGKPNLLLERQPQESDIQFAIERIHATINAPRTPVVYFIYDDYSDGKRVHELREQIRIHTGCEVLSPHVSTKWHWRRLLTSDGVLLFRCEAPYEWFCEQHKKLIQSVALRSDRTAPIACYSARSTGDSAGTRSREPEPDQLRIEAIETTGEPDIRDLQPFIAALQARARATLREFL